MIVGVRLTAIVAVSSLAASFRVGHLNNGWPSRYGAENVRIAELQGNQCRGRGKVVSFSRRDRNDDDGGGDLYEAIHRKEYEMTMVNKQHAALSDPVRMAMGYAVEDDGKRETQLRRLRLAGALRRVYDDPDNIANPQYNETQALKSPDERERQDKLLEQGMREMTMRRASFVVDIKRQSLSRGPRDIFARFDDAAMVAEAMVRLGADVVFVNVDYAAYGGDIAELRGAVRAVRKISKTAAVVMKDIVVDEIQLGLAKDAGADGILLIASVLGPTLLDFVNLATTIGLEVIVEVHTPEELQLALDCLCQNILVSNYDRLRRTYHPDQAYRLAGMFPGSGGPIVTLAGGGIETTAQMKRLLSAGYDGIVVGKAVMGSSRAPEFIQAVRDRTLLPAELSQWDGLEDAEFDADGNYLGKPKKIASDVPVWE